MYQKTRNPSQATHTTEQLLEDSDDDIEVVAKNDFFKVTLIIPSSKSLSIDTDSEIVLDDSDSDIEEVCNVSSTKTIPQSNSTTLDENKVVHSDQSCPKQPNSCHKAILKTPSWTENISF